MEKTQYSGEEKRRFKRLYKQFVVRIQIQSGLTKDWDVLVIRNISRGGMLFTYHKQLSEGMILNLKINVALNKDPIYCKGKVIHVRAFGDPRIYEAGVCFTEISVSDGDLISRVVEDIISKKEDE